MEFPATFTAIAEPWLRLLADDPVVRTLQLIWIAVGALLVFFVFFATRDILLRTRSFPATLACILLVALLPGIGFLIYLLVRPARTIRERALETMVRALHDGTVGRAGRAEGAEMPEEILEPADV